MNEQARASHGVIFDLDGTLADTLADLVDSINLALVEFGHHTLPTDQIRLMVGDGLRLLMCRASGSESPEALAEIIDWFRGIYRERMLRQTTLYPGIAAMLDQLREMRVPMSVLSNKKHEFTAPMCNALLSHWPFVRIQGMTEESLRKPDPTVALQLAEQLGCPPNRVFFVGDSDVDVETGRSAGMRTIAVTWGLRDEASLVAACPDHLVNDPAKVAEIVLNTCVPR